MGSRVRRCSDCRLRPQKGGSIPCNISSPRIEPGLGGDEAGFLGAFDLHCDLIHAAAVKIYKRARKGSYELIPTDF